jgi:hypothetical protein
MWDRDRGADWTPEHDDRLEDLTFEHQVYGSLIPETTFAIVEVLGELAPLTGPQPAPEPPGERPAA